jgi:hypothetical protein
MGEPVLSPSRKFTSARWMQVVCLTGALLCSAAAYALYLKEAWSSLTVFAAILVPLSIAGFIDSLVARVELHDEKLVVVANFRRREYPRSMFVRATHGKGVPVSLEYTSGGWLRLPSFVPGGTGMVNTLRAWLRRD